MSLIPFFSYWGIIRDLLKQAEEGSARLLALTEDFLENSRSPVSIIDDPIPKDSLPTPLAPQARSASGEKCALQPSTKPKRIYPILYKELSNDPLDSSSEAELDEEAFNYEWDRYGPDPVVPTVPMLPWSPLNTTPSLLAPYSPYHSSHIAGFSGRSAITSN